MAQNEDEWRANSSPLRFIKDPHIAEKIRADCEVAEAIVGRFDTGHYVYDDEFVQARLSHCDIQRKPTPQEMRQASAYTNQALAFHMFQKAFEKAERNDLKNSLTFPLDKWRRVAKPV